MSGQDEDRPGGLGNVPVDEAKQPRFRPRGHADESSPPTPEKAVIKTVEACCRGQAGHAQPPTDRRR
ncbi:hypothetical protein [Oleisolibacter albus]|uniref:hypothetical protein n=1 Tax=Oleisolibacter albus TaxID=2171757 RepID=UPI000DF1B9D0|nr:hypothetical protein [Oleisolibacter albus]